MDLNGNKSTDFFELAMVIVRKPLIFLILLLLPNTIQYNRKIESDNGDENTVLYFGWVSIASHNGEHPIFRKEIENQ